jgi:hypothetical protein
MLLPMNEEIYHKKVFSVVERNEKLVRISVTMARGLMLTMKIKKGR